MFMKRVIDVAEAKVSEYSAEELSEELESRYGYAQDQMSVECVNDDFGRPDPSRVRVVVYESDAETPERTTH